MYKGSTFQFAEYARRRLIKRAQEESVLTQVIGDARENIVEAVLSKLQCSGIISYFLHTKKFSYADIVEHTDFYVAVRTKKRLECFRIDVTGMCVDNSKNNHKSMIVCVDLNLSRNEVEEDIERQILDIIAKL